MQVHIFLHCVHNAGTYIPDLCSQNNTLDSNVIAAHGLTVLTVDTIGHTSSLTVVLLSCHLCN